jgi:hypothetical protein
MLEAYGTLDQTMRYYGTPEAPGGHFPFNFRLITDVNFGSTSAKEINATINEYLQNMTDGRTPNWVVSLFCVKVGSVQNTREFGSLMKL